MTIWIWLMSAAAVADELPKPTPVAPAATVGPSPDFVNTKMAQLAEKGAWDGVERAFVELLKDGVTPTRGEWMMGAQAARTLGDAATAMERTRTADQLGSTERTADALADYAATWGSVRLTGQPGEVGLTVPQRPFQPDRNAAIDYAAARIAKKGRFEGLLPVGDFHLAGVPFTVAPGTDAPLVLDARRAAPNAEVLANLQAQPDLPRAAPSRTRPLAAAAGGSAVLAGVSFALASQAHGEWASEEVTVDQLDPLRQRTNTLTLASGLTGVAALGLGVTAFVIRY